MSEKDIKALMDLAKFHIENPRSKEEILATFVGAGILDENENFTKPYKILESHFQNAENK